MRTAVVGGGAAGFFLAINLKEMLPQMEVTIEKIDEENLGAIFYFFETACGISAYVLGVNPFNQPGVEAYKKNMFALLEKPGFEEATKAIKARL